MRYIVTTNEDIFLPVRIHIPGAMERTTLSLGTYARRNNPEWPGTDSICFLTVTAYTWGTRLRSWLRHCATSQKAADSIPDGVTGIFH
jgi:hypothetical protein